MIYIATRSFSLQFRSLYEDFFVWNYLDLDYDNFLQIYTGAIKITNLKKNWDSRIMEHIRVRIFLNQLRFQTWNGLKTHGIILLKTLSQWWVKKKGRDGQSKNVIKIIIKSPRLCLENLDPFLPYPAPIF